MKLSSEPNKIVVILGGRPVAEYRAPTLYMTETVPGDDFKRITKFFREIDPALVVKRMPKKSDPTGAENSG